jgi:hypothetical protein
MFNLNIIQFLLWMLPPFLRQPKQTAWLLVLAKPMGTLWAELSALYYSLLLMLNTTVQHDVLQAYLRTKYPNVGTFKVFIKTNYDAKPQRYAQAIGEHHTQQYCYFISETPTATAPASISYSMAENNIPFDYTILVPLAYTASLPVITAVINKYRPAGKSYQIIFQNTI